MLTTFLFLCGVRTFSMLMSFIAHHCEEIRTRELRYYISVTTATTFMHYTQGARTSVNSALTACTWLLWRQNRRKYVSSNSVGISRLQFSGCAGISRGEELQLVHEPQRKAEGDGECPYSLHAGWVIWMMLSTVLIWSTELLQCAIGETDRWTYSKRLLGSGA